MTGINPDGLTARTARPAAIALVVLAASIGFVSAAQASGDVVLQEPPRYGLYYDRYEPTFYTGFAPRTADPNRIHLRLGRGNQLRVTVVLSEAALETYGRDLLLRLQTYRRLIDDGRIVPTQNTGFETFEHTLEELDIEGFVAAERSLSPPEVRARNLRLLERLNPDRVFRIRMPVDALVTRWVSHLTPDDRQRMTSERQLALLNLMLPTRLFVAELDPTASAELRALVAAAPRPDDGHTTDALGAIRADYLGLLRRISHGIYPVRSDELAFVEFTAIHPNGSFNEYTEYKGRKIPMFPTPGRRALTTHQRTKTVDHIPDKVSYSYSPWIPYMHVGTRLHNSFHTLWWSMVADRTAFLPAAWRADAHTYLWLLSRGPMSHGCTHLGTGHIAELRQILPSETKRLYEIDTFLNKSHQYDVFDIDGDFEPEVMGVRYFIAYSLRNNLPNRLRAPNERRAFYDWLYGGELRYDAQGNGYFENPTDARFVGRTAVTGRTYPRLPLYEAAYQPERVQFYRLVDIPFARELRKVGADHTFAP